MQKTKTKPKCHSFGLFNVKKTSVANQTAAAAAAATTLASLAAARLTLLPAALLCSLSGLRASGMVSIRARFGMSTPVLPGGP